MLAVVLALFGAVLSPAQADREDQLEQQEETLSDQIEQQHSELEHSSVELQRTSAVLERAQARLDTARAELATVLGELAVAKSRDAQMRRALAAARARLRTATDELADARRTVATAQAGIEQFAVQSYATVDPSLMSVDAVLSGKSPMAFPEMLSSAEAMVSAQTATLDQLEAAEIFLTLRQEHVARLRDKVAAKRAEAAAQLDRTERLTQQARDTKQTVQGLVADRRAAQQAAAAARQDDLRILAEMERERDRVQTLLEGLAAAAAAAAETTATPAPSPAPAPSSVNGGGVLDYPVPGAAITSPYGMRLHPILNVWKLHDGTDFGAGCGTPILAPADGSVVEQYYNEGYGNRVIVSLGTVDGQSLAASINHLDSFSTSPGQTFNRGDVIGYVGTTGYSTGCHLHFMVYVNGATVDPANWL
jgi:murein DD-endopeptidase MepM/ murein hydrolase activator NlpD